MVKEICVELYVISDFYDTLKKENRRINSVFLVTNLKRVKELLLSGFVKIKTSKVYNV